MLLSWFDLLTTTLSRLSKGRASSSESIWIPALKHAGMTDLAEAIHLTQQAAGIDLKRLKTSWVEPTHLRGSS